MHNRSKPKQHRFHYNIFMWWIDLDELPLLPKKFRLFGYNRFSLFSFHDKDHLQWPDNGAEGRTVKQNITNYLADNGIDLDGGKIYLLTHLRTLGHLFNPVSFYYCFDRNNEPVCAIAEVCNTFHEMKPFLMKTFHGGQFRLRTPKHFYVSPFTQLDDEFDFQVKIPNEKLNVRIDDFNKDGRFFISTLTGTRKILSDFKILSYFLRFPFITLQVITLIHWQAMLLWFRKISFQRKADHPHLQKNLQRPHKTLLSKSS